MRFESAASVSTSRTCFSKCHNIGFHLSVTRDQWKCWADMLDKCSITGLEGLADEPLAPVVGRPADEVSVKSAVARRTPRSKQTILLSAGAKRSRAAMQITAGSVKIKPFIFSRLSIARRNIRHSHYDRGRFQMLTITALTLFIRHRWLSQGNAKWGLWLTVFVCVCVWGGVT